MGKKLAMFAAVVLLLPGCATMTNRTMGGIINSWQGQPVANVEASWGQPLKVYHDGSTAVYRWTDSQREVPWKLGVETERNTPTPGASFVRGICTRELTVNASGLVTSGSFYGDNCCVAAVSGYCKSLVHSRS